MRRRPRRLWPQAAGRVVSASIAPFAGMAASETVTGSMDVPGGRYDPLEEVAELARKADEIDYNRERRDDHCHVFHRVPVRQNCRPPSDEPNSLLLSSQRMIRKKPAPGCIRAAESGFPPSRSPLRRAKQGPKRSCRDTGARYARAGARAHSITPTRRLDPKEKAPARERRGQNQIETSLTGHTPTVVQSISKY